MILIADLENEWQTRFPNTPRVRAYQTLDRKSWVIKCPYCPYHHHHGCDGTPASAGLRSPHCSDGARGKPGYFLIPSGFITEAKRRKFEEKDMKLLRRSTREAAARFFRDLPDRQEAG